MRKCPIDKRNTDQIILCRFDRFLNGIWNFFGLSCAKPYMTSLIANNDQSSERHILTALYYLGHTVDRDQLIF